MSRSFLSQLARDGYKVSKYARIANTAQRGGPPAVARQYAKRVAQRRILGALTRRGLW